MPLSISCRNYLLRSLDKVYDELNEKYSCEIKAIGSKIPIGGSGWMDLFFRMEGIRGVMAGLRSSGNLLGAIEVGKTTSSIAVRIWNGRKEYQVHRWEETCYGYLEHTVRRIKREWDIHNQPKDVKRIKLVLGK